jgi:hypothetical protein
MVLVQVICNRICLFNVAVPLVFIFFILRLPVNLSTNWVLTLSFVIGLIVDIFSNTQGMNALSCTILGGLRKPIFSLYCPREDDMSNPIPSINSLGVGVFVKYVFTMTMLFCVLTFVIQSFTFFNFQLTLLRIVCSGVLTSVLIFGFDSLTSAHREKRL